MSVVAVLNCRVDCIGFVKSWEIFKFPASAHASANRVAAIRLELANKITHGGGTYSNHVGYLCNEKEDIWLAVFCMMRKHQWHHLLYIQRKSPQASLVSVKLRVHDSTIRKRLGKTGIHGRVQGKILLQLLVIWSVCVSVLHQPSLTVWSNVSD